MLTFPQQKLSLIYFTNVFSMWTFFFFLVPQHNSYDSWYNKDKWSRLSYESINHKRYLIRNYDDVDLFLSPSFFFFSIIKGRLLSQSEIIKEFTKLRPKRTIEIKNWLKERNTASASYLATLSLWIITTQWSTFITNGTAKGRTREHTNVPRVFLLCRFSRTWRSNMAKKAFDLFVYFLVFL